VSVNVEEYVGVISKSTDGRHVYTSAKYGFQITYPQGWYVGDNHLGYGTLQLYNYDYQKAEKEGFPPRDSVNKIEAGISTSNTYASSTDYPEKTRQTKQVTIAGQTANVDDVELVGGEKIRAYFIPLLTMPGKYLGINIYGNPTNFHILDEIMRSFEWKK
jgi:hypothetical protein